MVHAGIDLSKGYPEYPIRPKTIELASDIRKEVGIVFFFFALGWELQFSELTSITQGWEHKDPGARADKEKKALFSAAKEVIHLSPHLGTEYGLIYILSLALSLTLVIG